MFKSTSFFISKCNKLIVKADYSHVQQQQFKLFLLPHCIFNSSLQQFLLHVLLKPYYFVIKFLMAYLQNHGHTHIFFFFLKLNISLHRHHPLPYLRGSGYLGMINMI